MRIRYLEVDYFAEASILSREECLRNLMPLPHVPSLRTIETKYSLHSFFEIFCNELSFPITASESLANLPCVKDSWNRNERFLADFVPRKVDQPSILDLTGVGVVLKLIPGQTIGSHDDENRKNFHSGEYPIDPNVISCDAIQDVRISEQLDLTSDRHQRLKDPSTSRMLNYSAIEPPVLEETFANHYWLSILSDFGCPAPRAVEKEQIEINIPKKWLDIFLPSSLQECEDNPASAVEAQQSTFWSTLMNQEWKIIPEVSWIYESSCDDPPLTPDETDGSNPKILKPLELFEIKGELHFSSLSLSKVMPGWLSGCIELQQVLVEKEVDRTLHTELSAQFMLAKYFTLANKFDENFEQPMTLTSEFLEEPPKTSATGNADISECVNPWFGTYFNLETTICADFLTGCFACVGPPNCATDIRAVPVPVGSFPEKHPPECFEGLVILRELRLDDSQFKSLPVPVLNNTQSEELHAALGRLMSLDCKPTTMTATNSLYLDWHFAQSTTCRNTACFSLQSQLNLEMKCEPIQSSYLSTDLVSPKTSYDLVMNLLGVEDDLHRRTGFGSYVIPTNVEDNVCLRPSSLPKLSQNQSLNSYQDEGVPEKLERTEAASGTVSKCHIHFSTSAKVHPVSKLAEVKECQTSPSLSKFSGTYCSGSVPGGQRHHVIQATICATEAANGNDLDSKGLGFQDTEKFGKRRRNSKSLFDHLTCFVQARKGIVQDTKVIGSTADESDKIIDRRTAFADAPRGDSMSLNTLPTDHDEGGNNVTFCEHLIVLSVEIRSLMDSLASDYYGLLTVDEIFGKKTVEKLKVPRVFGFDSNGNSVMQSLISRVASEQPTQQRQVVMRGLTALHVLRHTAMNLCIYGIRVAHLYLENLFERIDFLEGWIVNSRIELEEAYNQVEGGTLEDHPKLQFMKKLLRSMQMKGKDPKNASKKLLLVADRKAFFTLFKDLASLGMNPYQVDRKEHYLQRGILLEGSTESLKQEISDALAFSNCLLVSHAYITSSFPVEAFTAIIQYSFCQEDCKVDEFLRKGRCERHVFKVSMNSEESKTNSVEASDHQQELDHPSDRVFKLLEESTVSDESPKQAVANLREQQCLSAINKNAATTIPDANEPLSHKERYTIVLPSASDGGRLKERQGKEEDNHYSERRCEMIIVANVSLPNHHRITGRRSSYQKILSLEKENLQVVERELRIPTDLLLSPATCLVIYNPEKLKLERQDGKDHQKLLENEVEILMKAISFSFRNCIMIFEGPPGFISVALDAFGHINAVAVVLDVQIQCFISELMEVTDNIVMKCIEEARKSKKMALYATMAEGPTIAEAFLTEFPSINSLTAHAILSSGCPLATFIALSHEQQRTFVEGYNVPKHCLELFRAQCTFREMGSAVISARQPNLSETNIPECNLGMIDEEKYEDLNLPTHMSSQRPLLEMWNRFPDFPPASELSADSEYSAIQASGDSHSICFPEFPPASEITGDSNREDSENRDFFANNSSAVHEIFEHSSDVSPEDRIFWPKKNSASNKSMQLLPRQYDTNFSFPTPVMQHRRGVSLVTSLPRRGEHNDGGADKKGLVSCRFEVPYGSFQAKAPLPTSFSEFFVPRDVGRKPVVATQTNTVSSPNAYRSQKKTTLQASCLDRFRHQPKRLKAAAGSTSLQTTLQFPKIFPRTNRIQSSIMTSSIPADKKSKKLLGLTKRGSDSQQRLVWINRNSNVPDMSKRQKKDPAYRL